jgi:hypothetical protein
MRARVEQHVVLAATRPFVCDSLRLFSKCELRWKRVVCQKHRFRKPNANDRTTQRNDINTTDLTNSFSLSVVVSMPDSFSERLN